MANKKKALGRGLTSLIPVTNQNKEISKSKQKEGLFDIYLADIQSNPQNPRKNFDEESLKILAQNIKRIGLIQPITVQKLSASKYQIITGERRFRAVKLAGFTKIPAFVKKVTERENVIMSLVENIQRENLDVIEEAEHYNLLRDTMKLAEIADVIGKSRSSINNKVRLLSLPGEIKSQLSDGLLSEGHVRPLLSIQNNDHKVKLAKKIIDKSLSVRAVEEEVYKLQNPLTVKSSKVKKKDPSIKNCEKKIRSSLGTKVSITHNNKSGKGKLVIDYFGSDDLERIMDIICKK